MALVIHAHPYPRRSRTGAALLAALRDLPGLEVHSLYDLYPDFDIDVAAEQAAVERANLVIWLAPLYWYSVPAMMKHWFDEVLLGGWAHGEGGHALKDKSCLWATTTGDVEKYALTGAHAHPFEAFVPVVEQTARYCHMKWLEPFVVHDSHELTDTKLAEAARHFRKRVEAHSGSERNA
ncbi:MAG TPA: NAD(P)H-dependent oxidoreductase [Usitatibacter sp.]|jgi:glutathione-regulated potassium-efflux system ancillary protein KefF